MRRIPGLMRLFHDSSFFRKNMNCDDSVFTPSSPFLLFFPPKMLATLLIIRQFLQNVKEVLQPYLYERHKLGELTPRAVWDLLLSVLLKYARLAAGKAQSSPAEQPMQGLGLRSARPGWGPSDRRSDSPP